MNVRDCQRPLRSRSLVVTVTCVIWLGGPRLASAQAAAAPSDRDDAGLARSVTELRRLLETQRQILEQQTQMLESQRRDIDALRLRLDGLGAPAVEPAAAWSPTTAEPSGTQATAAPPSSTLPATEPQVTQPNPELPIAVVSAGDFPRSITIPGTETAFRIGGQGRCSCTPWGRSAPTTGS